MSVYDSFSSHELQILKNRAQRVATSVQGEQDHERLTILIVKIRGETYALPIEAVLAVYDSAAVTPLPCVPEFVAGLVNLRGRLFPVLDLGIVLAVPGDTPTEGGALVLASGQDYEVALRVEQISEVKMIPVSEILPAPETIELTHASALRGILADGTAVLDLKAILSDTALLVDHVGY